MRHLLFILIPAFFLGLHANAQQARQADSVNFYGRLLAQMAAYDQTVEMQNNGSRIGINLQRTSLKGFRAEGRIELGINLLKNNTSFNRGSATADNPSAFLTETVKPVTTRLGYIGLSSDTWGTLRFGKQWGVYYDVGSWTDNFNVFGSLASGSFNKGTDGGSEGTGRAESAITYHNTFHRFTIGLQGQTPGQTYNFGGSLVYNLPCGVSLGAAYNYYQIPENIRQAVLNSKKAANSAVVSFRYAAGSNYIAVLYAYNESEDEFPNDTTIIGFAANGIELYAHHYFTPKFMVLGGFNYLKPSGKFNLLPSDFRILSIPVGAAYAILPDLICYSEFEFNKNISVKGVKGTNVYCLGFRYNFSFGRSGFKI